MRSVLAALFALLVLAGCASPQLDPDAAVVQHYVWRSPTRIISDPNSSDDLTVYLNPTDTTHALVRPRGELLFHLALGDQQTRWYMDRKKHEKEYREALIMAFVRAQMDCTPTADAGNILPTMYAIEFTYRCFQPSTAAR
jgi:hypothetical protein